MQRTGSVPILCTNVNITINSMLKFDENVGADANVNIDDQCKRTLTVRLHQLKELPFNVGHFLYHIADSISEI